MPYPYFFFDYWYLVFCLPPLILALWASANVRRVYRKYSKVPCSRGMTGEQSARLVLSRSAAGGVQIGRVAGEMTDHFDPRRNEIALSDGVFDTPSVAAVGIAAHEAGHAAQYADGYAPMKVRTFLVPLANIGSSAGIYLALIGAVLSFPILIDIGIVLFLAFVLFQLVTLPVEFNASRRALAALEESGRLTDEELRGAKKVLRAAALTYLAALAAAIGNLLRLFALSNRRRR